MVIPFRGDPAILNWALEGFAHQQLPDDLVLDIRIGGDGCAPHPAPQTPARNVTITLLELPRSGVCGAKNLILQDVDTDVIIFSNADTRPEPDFVARHVSRIMSLPAGSMVLGASPFDHTIPRTIFDALIERTPAIFFYCQMQSGQWYDYRCAWNLNVSVRAEDYRRTGGFSPLLSPYGYEDLVLSHGVMGAERKGVFYDADARVTHRHPMTLDQYLMREEMLGLMGPALYQASPEVAENIFGQADARKMADQFSAWVEMDRQMHQWIYRRLCEWAPRPESDLQSQPDAQALLNALYQMHIPLKRLSFRLGFLRGMNISNPDDRVTTGLWKKYL